SGQHAAHAQLSFHPVERVVGARFEVIAFIEHQDVRLLLLNNGDHSSQTRLIALIDSPCEDVVGHYSHQVGECRLPDAAMPWCELGNLPGECCTSSLRTDRRPSASHAAELASSYGPGWRMAGTRTRASLADDGGRCASLRVQSRVAHSLQG